MKISVSVFFYLFTFTINLCPYWKKNVETVNDLVQVERTSRRPTGLSMRYHGRRIFIGHLCPRLFVKTYIWNVSRGAMHRRWQTRTLPLAWSMQKLLLQKFRQYATDFVFFTDEKVLLVTSPDDQQNKVSGRQQKLLKKKLSIFFSAGTAWSAAWPPLNCPCVPHFLNSLLT